MKREKKRGKILKKKKKDKKEIEVKGKLNALRENETKMSA
jgi:hypothetical protein